MKALTALTITALLVGSAHAQQRPPAAQPAPLPPQPTQQPAAQQPQPPAAQATCLSQHAEAPGVSAAALINRGFDIKAAVPGGLWAQKDREVYFCNSGRALENDVLCWRLREPIKGQACQ